MPEEKDKSSLLAVIGDEVDTYSRDSGYSRPESACPPCRFRLQDTVTGFLLAGVGNVDLRRKSNFLIVNESKQMT